MKALVLIVILAVSLTGCAGFDTDRWDAWQQVRVQEEITKREILKVRAQPQKEPEVVIEIDSQAEMQTYSQMKQMEFMAKALEMMSVALVKVAGGGESDLSTTPMPTGAWAEVLDSAGNAAGKFFSAPGVVAAAVAIPFASVAKNAGPKVYGDGNEVEITTAKSGKDATIISGKGNAFDKVDNDVVQVQAPQGGDNNYQPKEPAEIPEEPVAPVEPAAPAEPIIIPVEPVVVQVEPVVVPVAPAKSE